VNLKVSLNFLRAEIAPSPSRKIKSRKKGREGGMGGGGNGKAICIYITSFWNTASGAAVESIQDALTDTTT